MKIKRFQDFYVIEPHSGFKKKTQNQPPPQPKPKQKSDSEYGM